MAIRLTSEEANRFFINSKSQFSDAITDTQLILKDLLRLLKASGYSNLAIEINPSENYRFWLGGVLVELKSPKDITKDYFHEGVPYDQRKTLQGFVLREKSGPGRALIVQDKFFDVVSTIGHEVFGHLLSPKLDNKLDEEAKAYAFELYWRKLMQKECTFGIDSLEPINLYLPEREVWPIHHQAIKFVTRLTNQGYGPLGLHKDLSSKRLKVPNSFS